MNSSGMTAPRTSIPLEPLPACRPPSASSRRAGSSRHGGRGRLRVVPRRLHRVEADGEHRVVGVRRAGAVVPLALDPPAAVGSRSPCPWEAPAAGRRSRHREAVTALLADSPHRPPSWSPCPAARHRHHPVPGQPRATSTTIFRRWDVELVAAEPPRKQGPVEARFTEQLVRLGRVRPPAPRWLPARHGGDRAAPEHCRPGSPG